MNPEINIDEIILKAAKIISPVWPLRTFIARNPLCDIESLNFEDAINLADLFLTRDCCSAENHSDDVNRELIKWSQAFLDEGQAAITMPEREKGFYRSWSLLAPFDKKLGCGKKNQWLLSLPTTSHQAILFLVDKLKIPINRLEEYLMFTLAKLPGWGGYIKWLSEWQGKNSSLKNPINLKDFIAVRLAITLALEGELIEFPFQMEIKLQKESNKKFFQELEKKEDLFVRELLKKMVPETIRLQEENTGLHPPEAQIVCCIDVRSEQFRMQLEKEGNYETFGFAGFFGLPVSIQHYHQETALECCPVLIKPAHEICEEPAEQAAARISHHQSGRIVFDTVSRIYRNLKYNFSTPFALVETLGVWCGLWMAIRTLLPSFSVKLRHTIKELIMPTLKTTPKISIPFAEQIAYAESALRTMGFTKNFSPLVVFCGHGGKTENNPFASALDCGACGGNRGGPNGKLLAKILNSFEIRNSLIKKGIEIPHNTLFLGAEHNTTTDEVIIDNDELIKNEHIQILEKLNRALDKARVKNNQSRCCTLGLNKSGIAAKNHVIKRSSDWAEVRPEWGLARNAALIIGPRGITKNLDLGGRCFLHSYDWREDENGESLEKILTAPMVVAQWINAQYFFSTLNNVSYGSGSKITQNITGKLGIIQGNGSDLMYGLSLQSVHSADDRPYHDPVRLQTIVYAPVSTIDSIIEKQPKLRMLLINKWAKLVAVNPNDSTCHRFVRDGEWVEIESHKKINSKTCEDESKIRISAARL